MIATNNTNTGGTADNDLEAYATSETFVISGTYPDEQERYEPPSIDTFKLAILCGAIVGWTTSKYGDFGYRVLYWKNRAAKHFKPQVSCIRRVFFSGYMSQHRGLHWSRRERYGLK